VKAPQPTALRLHTRARDLAGARVPFGLKEWNDGAGDVAVLLETAAEGGGNLADIVAQLPEVSSLAASATIVVLGEAARRASSWRRWIGSRTVTVPRSLRCTALLVRGYVDIGAATWEGKDDLVWGRTAASVDLRELVGDLRGDLR
jgi:hypothetical protein